MKVIVAILLAAAVGSAAHAVGLGGEAVYVLRSITRYLVSSAGMIGGLAA